LIISNPKGFLLALSFSVTVKASIRTYKRKGQKTMKRDVSYLSH
jgi:hypothetical protein